MKSHTFIGACVAIMLFRLIAACSANNTAVVATFQNSSGADVDLKTAKTLDCRKANDYSFLVVQNPNRKKDSDTVIPEDLNIIVGDEIISKIELPKESEVKNFSLNSIQKNKTGFQIEVDWGGGLYHYKLQFTFRCEENNFYLYKVRKESFSTTNPDSGNFLDKKETKETKIEPRLPIEKFVMGNYL
ncbi:MAG TPA: hypothetical protein VJ372_17690 [Pyrinomonadaceae bacterium]|nr:hypothetical protein [Pyrinomonadaceae bacterium]